MRAWTLMVFMVAETDRDWVFADHDIGELEKVGSNDEVAVIVQVHRRRGSAVRYFIPQSGGRQQLERVETSPAAGNLTPTPNPADLTPTPNPKNARVAGAAKNAATSDPRILKEFLGGVLEDKEFQAQHYALILWGHSIGFGFGSTGDPLEVFELANVLREVFKSRRGKKLEILGCDACSMSKAETAYELRDAVDLLVGSQIGIPLYNGWPYDAVLRVLRRQPTPSAAATGIVRAFYNSYEQKAVALAALDLGHADVLKRCLTNVSNALLTAMTDPSKIDLVLAAFYSTRSDDFEPLWDFPDLCRNLKKRQISESVSAAAQSALESLGFQAGEPADEPGDEENESGDEEVTLRRLVIANRRKPRGKIRGLNGFGVYVPLYVPEGVDGCESIRQRCDFNMALLDGTRWGDLVRLLQKALLRLTLEDKAEPQSHDHVLPEPLPGPPFTLTPARLEQTLAAYLTRQQLISSASASIL